MTIAPPMSERRVSLIGGLLTAIGPVSMALYTPAMTEIVRAFGTTEAAVKMTLTLYFGGFACAQLVAGPLSDALGRRSAAARSPSRSWRSTVPRASSRWSPRGSRC